MTTKKSIIDELINEEEKLRIKSKYNLNLSPNLQKNLKNIFDDPRSSLLSRKKNLQKILKEVNEKQFYLLQEIQFIEEILEEIENE